MSQKSLLLSYALWLVGGIFGLHHFYLGRDIQGFIWWCTLGGYCGAGWLRDLFLMPSYVKDANNDPEYLARLSQVMRFYKSPPFSTMRFLGEILIGYFFGCMINMAVPKEEIVGFDLEWLKFLVPLGVALGVWCVGNIGHEEGSFVWTLLAAYCSFPVYLRYDGDISYTIMVMITAYVFDANKKWKRKISKKRHLLKRTAVLVACGALYLGLWGSAIYYNGTITDSEGDEIPINEAANQFFNSLRWIDFQQAIFDSYNYFRQNGWQEFWKMALEILDSQGEDYALRVLGLDSSHNQTAINSKCRQMSVKYHPDKVKDPEEKKEAQEKFYEIQQACEILSTSRAKRRRKNKRSQTP